MNGLDLWFHRPSTWSSGGGHYSGHALMGKRTKEKGSAFQHLIDMELPDLKKSGWRNKLARELGSCFLEEEKN